MRGRVAVYGARTASAAVSFVDRCILPFSHNEDLPDLFSERYRTRKVKRLEAPCGSPNTSPFGGNSAAQRSFAICKPFFCLPVPPVHGDYGTVRADLTAIPKQPGTTCAPGATDIFLLISLAIGVFNSGNGDAGRVIEV